MGLNCSKLSEKIEHCRTVIFPRMEYRISKFFSDKCYEHRSPTPSPRNSDSDVVVINICDLNNNYNFKKNNIEKFIENDITLDDMEETPPKTPPNSPKVSPKVILPQKHPSTSVETSEYKSTSALSTKPDKDSNEEFVHVDIPDINNTQ